MAHSKDSPIHVLIPMAGIGKRFSDMGYKESKPFLPMGKKTMIEMVVENLRHPDMHFIFVVNIKTINVALLRKKLSKILGDFDIVEIDYVPQGSAMSCMEAKDLINNDTPLIAVNCDQIIEDFDYTAFKRFCDFYQPDGILGTFYSTSPKNSYVKINDQNEVTETKEKVVISNLATNGLHYWKKGKYFVDSVEEMVQGSDALNGEYYVAPSYNYLIQKGMKIMPYHFNMHFPIGIPEDYESYRKHRNL